MDPINQTGQTSGGSNKTLYIIIGILVVLLIGGYFMRGNYGMMRGANGVDVDRNLDGSTTYKSDYGTVTSGGNKPPAGWPSDAPIYPGASISQSISANSQIVGTEDSLLVNLTTSDSVQMVTDYYRKELVKEGWNIYDAMSKGALLFATKDNRMISVTTNALKGGDTMVIISTGITPESMQKSLDAISAAQKK